jgi:hypothetical protein
MSRRVLICCWAFGVASVLPASASSGQAAPGRTYALVICGISKDPTERATKERIVNDLRTYLLEQAGVEPRRLTVLTPDSSPSSTAAQSPTADNIKKAIDSYASMVGPTDQFLFFYTGQANAVTGELRLNLPGPDIAHNDLAAWLNAVKTTRQLIILDCPCAAAAAKTLARRGRVILCAAHEDQPYATRFGTHFVPALAHAPNDTNHDGRVSVLEAFTAAARAVEQWYQERQLVQTETPCLEDDGDGAPAERPWRFAQDGADGARAAEFFLAPAGGSDGR